MTRVEARQGLSENGFALSIEQIEGIWACFGHSKVDKDSTVGGDELFLLLQVLVLPSPISSGPPHTDAVGWYGASSRVLPAVRYPGASQEEQATNPELQPAEAEEADRTAQAMYQLGSRCARRMPCARHPACNVATCSALAILSRAL
jgi:hypothetical protein